jgi:hypothetical protein
MCVRVVCTIFALNYFQHTSLSVNALNALLNDDRVVVVLPGLVGVVSTICVYFVTLCCSRFFVKTTNDASAVVLVVDIGEDRCVAHEAHRIVERWSNCRFFFFVFLPDLIFFF